MQFCRFLHIFATSDNIVTLVDNSNNDEDGEDENHIQDSKTMVNQIWNMMK